MFQRSQFEAAMLLKMPLINLVFNKDRCKCPIVPASLEAFKRFRDSGEQEMALVFKAEGEFKGGEFTFNIENSHLFPLQITRELAFKFLFQIAFQNLPENAVDHALKTDVRAREFVLALISNSGGEKTQVKQPQPIDPGPTGTALQRPVQVEQEVETE
jgi:hypothetical protein